MTFHGVVPQGCPCTGTGCSWAAVPRRRNVVPSEIPPQARRTSVSPTTSPSPILPCFLPKAPLPRSPQAPPQPFPPACPQPRPSAPPALPWRGTARPLAGRRAAPLPLRAGWGRHAVARGVPSHSALPPL